jgi:hypothetical protein
VRSPESYFSDIALALRTVNFRNEIKCEEVPSPQRLAPFSFAYSAEVNTEFPASGRFVLLYDPMGQDGWSGRFRIVTYVRAEIELELASDPALIDLGWSWLRESLAEMQLSYISESGTVTQIRSSSFGAIESRLDENEIEIRASWTPLSANGNPDLAANEIVEHCQAWIDILSRASGLPPLPRGTQQLPVKK